MDVMLFDVKKSVARTMWWKAGRLARWTMFHAVYQFFFKMIHDMDSKKNLLGEEERHIRDSGSSEWPCGGRTCP